MLAAFSEGWQIFNYYVCDFFVLVIIDIDVDRLEEKCPTKLFLEI